MSKEKTQNPDNVMPFDKENYILLAVGVVVIVIGYLIMSADSEYKDATEFSLSLDVAPWILLIGYAEIIFAILWKPKKKS